MALLLPRAMQAHPAGASKLKAVRADWPPWAREHPAMVHVPESVAMRRLGVVREIGMELAAEPRGFKARIRPRFR